MIFYFTVSSVYSFGKTFLTEESEKNGNFLLKDRPAAGLSAADEERKFTGICHTICE